MSVITEAALRVLLKDEDLEALKEYRVDAGTIVTPSARAWLIDNKIDLLIGEKRVIRNPSTQQDEPAAKPQRVVRQQGAANADNGVLPGFEKPARYESQFGGFYEEKPEHMTALHGNSLVLKDHKVIALRGRLDSLEAKMVEVQLAFHKLGLAKGVQDVGDALCYVKDILRSEVLDEPVPPMLLMGMDEAEIRSRSHTPKKFYGMPHFSASFEDGEAVVLLNSLRTAVREVELVAYSAFKQENGEPSRPDIVQAFNRLSSAFYVMMFRAKAGEYGP